jgi:hypothetical protein
LTRQDHPSTNLPPNISQAEAPHRLSHLPLALSPAQENLGRRQQGLLGAICAFSRHPRTDESPSGLFSQFPQAAFPTGGPHDDHCRHDSPRRNLECPVVQAALEGTASSLGSRRLELTESTEKDPFGSRIGTRLRERGRAKQQGSLLPFLPRQKVLARSTFLARRLDRTVTRHNTPFCL